MDLPRTALHALHDQAAKLGDRPALWSKRQGTWLPTSWRDHAKRVRHFALGLVGLGLEPGSTVGLMAFNREEWLVAHLGAMAVGAVPFGIYVTSPPERGQSLLAHARAHVLVVDDVERARRALARARARCPSSGTSSSSTPPADSRKGQCPTRSWSPAAPRPTRSPTGIASTRCSPGDLATLLYHGADTSDAARGDAQPPQPAVDRAQAPRCVPARRGRAADLLSPARPHRRAADHRPRTAAHGCGPGLLRRLAGHAGRRSARGAAHRLLRRSQGLGALHGAPGPHT